MGKLTSNQFLFGFEGRINRAKYWYALLASTLCCFVFLSAAALALSGIYGATVKSVQLHVLAILGDPPSLPFSADFGRVDPETARHISLIFHFAAAPIFLIGFWFLAATTIKRLHDRDKSGWWLILFLIVPALLNGLADRLNDESYVILILSGSLAYAAFAFSAWGFVELLFLNGTNGPNRFGPDPLVPAIPDAPAPARWDQQSELEFVPHSAGPSPGPQH
jgi:uncharacterized membrane protein YhaH (DUF805 family)